MKILITGAKGQLGIELERQLKPNHSVIALGKKDLDITNKSEVKKCFNQFIPDVVIHAAAFTQVERCEEDRIQAFEVNGLGTGNIALEATKIGSKMLYISSDYVFDGKKQTPYLEQDKPNPQSIYGMSKLLGEQFVLNFNKGTVVRTSWLFGHDGNNFVKTMINLAKNKKEVKVVNDQIGSPTYAPDLTKIIVQLINKNSGIYHVSNTGSCTWFEFAKAIFIEAEYDPEMVKPTSTKDYGSLTPRPQYSSLGHNALAREKINSLRPWQVALKEFIKKECLM